MIRPLRRRHGDMIGLLSIALPIAFVASLAERTPDPRVAALPEFVRDVGAGAVVWEHNDLWGELSISTWLQRDEAGLRVGLRPLHDLKRPEVLAYWAPEGAAAGAIPDDAVLLGPVAGTSSHRFPLPEPRGRLLLYSLGHSEIVGTALLPEDASWE